MCNRYRHADEQVEFALCEDFESLPKSPQYNIAPTELGFVIVSPVPREVVARSM